MDITWQDIQQHVQEQGSFSVLTWLLEAGWLAYPRYEQWRYGGWDTLVEPSVSPGEHAQTPDTWVSLLRRVAQLAAGLGLTAVGQDFFDWRPEHATRRLRLAHDAWTAEQLALRWQRPTDIRQLDLFLDNGAALAEQDVMAALAARDLYRAERAYQRLVDCAPAHDGLASLESLLAYSAHLVAQPGIAVADHSAVWEEYNALWVEVAPLARSALRHQARDYLAPAWRRLAQAMVGLPFDARQPDFHVSVVWAQLPDWQAVIDSICQQEDCCTQPILLLRWVVALQHAQRAEQALWLWGYLAEQQPALLQTELPRLGSPRVQSLWKRFCEVEPELPDNLFTAWLVLAEPGLLQVERNDPRLPRPVSDAWQAACALAHARLTGSDEIAARKALHAQSPDLLHWYLRDG